MSLRCLALTGLLLWSATAMVQLQLSPDNYMKACTVISSGFDPVNVELRFPSVVGKKELEDFSIKVTNLVTFEQISDLKMGDSITFRYSYTLETNIPHELCVEFNTVRDIVLLPPIYVGFSAVEDFQHWIGRVQVPAQLASSQNLKTLFHVASQLKAVSAVIKSHQVKQRALQDQIVSHDLHKENRIWVLGLIEVCILLFCGVYQVFALRRFLIEKNIY